MVQINKISTTEKLTTKVPVPVVDITDDITTITMYSRTKDYYGIELQYAGELIKSTDPKEKFKFYKYKTSTMWHQVTVNHDGKYKKDEILAVIGDIVLEEFYPCYYRVSICI